MAEERVYEMVAEFQQRLLTDATARREFAENPARYLQELGIQLPSGLEIPRRIPIEELESAVSDVNSSLAERGATLDEIDPRSTAAVTRFVEDAVPMRTRDLRYMEQVHDEFASAVGAQAEEATVAVVGAVVAAVVAVPVAVYGRTVMEDVVQPQIGIEGISRRASGISIQGPEGLRIDGLNIDQVADLVTRLRGRPGGGG
jgi:hypothetical protein